MIEEWKRPEGFSMVLDPMTGRYINGFDRQQEYRFLRYGESEPSIFRMVDAHPAFNIAGLYYAAIRGIDAGGEGIDATRLEA